MTFQQASKQAARADRNLERLFGYYSQPDRHLCRKKQRRLRHWMNVRERAEGKLWKVVKPARVFRFWPSSASPLEICAWCFPGLRTFNGVEATHTCCALHKWRMEFEHIFLASEYHSFWQQEGCKQCGHALSLHRLSSVDDALRCMVSGCNCETSAVSEKP